MKFRKVLTPEEARAMGIPSAELVVHKPFVRQSGTGEKAGRQARKAGPVRHASAPADGESISDAGSNE